MTTPNVDDDKRHRTVTIIWASMLSAAFLYAVIGYTVRGAGVYEVTADKQVLLLVLAALALTTTAASFFLKRALLLKAAQEQRPDRAQTAYIVAFAVAESAVLIGLVALFVTGSTYSYLLFALGLVGILLHKPGRDHLLAASYKNRPWG